MFHSTDNQLYKRFKTLETNYVKIRDEIPAFDKSTVTIKRGEGEWHDTESGANLLKTLETNMVSNGFICWILRVLE